MSKDKKEVKEAKINIEIHTNAQKGTASEITSAELYKEDPLNLEELNKILLENRVYCDEVRS